MLPGRRLFLLQSGAVVAAAVTGCRGSRAPAKLGDTPRPPAAVSRAGRIVSRVLPGVPTTDGAGVRLSRVIGQPALRHLDPFVLLDRFHSDDPGAYVRGFPDHPHRGFETVTVMLSGRMRHRDSRGNHGLIVGGGAQWMTAGRGIVHSEMPEQVEGLMSGFQLWVNLPAAEKMCPQLYQDLAPTQIAEERLSPAGSRVRIIAGQGGPVRERPTQPTLMTVALEDDRAFSLDTPRDHTVFVFVGAGAVEIGPEGGSTSVSEGTLAVLGPGDQLRVRATDRRSEVLVAAARPLGEPIVQRGPFVMNTEEEIRRAWDDYRAGVLDRT
jgi:redox-sensitive bicupin YhaK (pirin superfamily)